MKTTKKIFALLLALAMVLSMAVTAFADEPAPEYVKVKGETTTGAAYITIDGARAGTYYELYRIFDVEVVKNTGEPIYKVRQYKESGAKNWNTFVQENSGENKLFTVSADGIYVKSSLLETYNDLGDLDKAAKMQLFAADVFKYADDNKITADINVPITISGEHVSADPRPYGFYVMRSFTIQEGVRTYSPKANVFTVPAMSKTGPVGVEINEKNEISHDVDKFVREDSLKNPADDSVGWVESNVAEIDQEVEFKITVDLAPGTGTYTIVDKMDKFMLVQEPVVTHSVLLTEGNQYTYTPNKVQVGESEIINGFSITLEDDFRASVTDADTLTIRYTAKLMSDAVIAGAGNENEVKLYHLEDPDEIITEETEAVATDSTITYTCKINGLKVDETETNPLAGAEFELRKESGEALKFTKTGNIYVIDHDAQDRVVGEGQPPVPATKIISGENGEFIINGLDTKDRYYLVETKAPEGYVAMDKIEIVIDTTGNAYVENLKVINLPGVEMPSTGGMGTTIFYAIGGLMTAAALILLITKKRMAA